MIKFSGLRSPKILCERVFTQRVDDAHGQLNGEKHEGPSRSSEPPRLHAIMLLLSRKHFLHATSRTRHKLF